MKTAMKHVIVFFAGLSLLSTTLGSVVNAAMVGTQSAVATEQRAEYVSDIKDWLAQEDVKQQLVDLGVNPDDASGRISALTTEELQTLHQRISELPAGAGVVEVIGIVFIVFVILELLGVTNVFTSF